MKFYVTFERPQFYTVAVEAPSQGQAISMAEDTIGHAKRLDDYYTASGDLELTNVEEGTDGTD